MNVRRPKGTNDILPEDTGKWQFIEARIQKLCRRYGYQEIGHQFLNIPNCSPGASARLQISLKKKMYTFRDRGGRSLTLRPEGTACVVRAFIENGLDSSPLPVKLYYLGPMFRYERPQAGRYRQFYQFGIEAIGSMDPFLDAEMITLPIELYRACGLDGFQVQINSIGCLECRGSYRDTLLRHLEGKADQFCHNCQSRLHRNPLRILDCKNPKCRELVEEVPPITDYLCPECADHFGQVKGYLDQLGVAYEPNPKLVRGFDYYTKTVFEIIVPALGAQNAIGAGGRYDGLVEEIGGKPQPAVGFAVGVERLILALGEQSGIDYAEARPDAFVAHFGGRTKARAVEIVTGLRRTGLWAELDYLGRSLKAQMKAADRLKCKWVVIVGEEELEQNTVKIRNMATGEEQGVSLDQIGAFLTPAGEEQGT